MRVKSTVSFVIVTCSFFNDKTSFQKKKKNLQLTNTWNNTKMISSSILYRVRTIAKTLSVSVTVVLNHVKFSMVSNLRSVERFTWFTTMVVVLCRAATAEPV